MVSYNRLMTKDWHKPRAALANSLQWYQSRWFKPWERHVRKHPEDFEMRYSLANGTAEIVPNNQRKKLSHKGKTMLNEKMKEIERFNSSLAYAASKTKDAKAVTRRQKRARCYICKKRGHVLWKCPDKKSKHEGETSRAAADKRPKYPESVHVKTDYMVEGSDKGNWNKIWYVSNMYKNHMSPMKSLFKRLKYGFKLLDIEEDEKKFIFSYGVGEAFIETGDKTLVIPNVYYTPEVTLNVLSTGQLESQGYITTHGRNRCRVKYMFDNEENAVNAQQDDEMICGDSTSIIERHNKFLEEYFESIDAKDDQNEECSLIKGMEDLEISKEDDHDYVDNHYLSMNGTLYSMKVNTFARFISFLDLIKIDKLVYGNWEVLKGKFVEVLEWFYIEYLKQDVLGELPPVIGVIRIDLLGLYKFVDAMGGYMNVTFNDEWDQVANILGLASKHHETVKEVYKEYIGMMKVYYEEAKRSRQGKPEDVAASCSGTAGKERPQVNAKTNAEVEEMPDETPRERSGTGKEDVNMEDSNYEATNHGKEASTSSSDDFIIIA
ncbi:ARID DNA-binding domain-containing protein [Tanacetum coccineum]